MKITVCDKCKAEIIGSPEYVIGKELCPDCADELDRVTENWCNGKKYSYNGREWHDQRLGFPHVNGQYLLTLKFPDGDKCVRTGQYTGFPRWYKTAAGLTPIEETGGKVTAWAEVPQPYNPESEDDVQ